MAGPHGRWRRVETAKVALASLTFWAVFSKMAFLAAPEAETLAHATLMLFRFHLRHLDDGQVHGCHAGVLQCGSVARTSARGPERPGLGSFKAERVFLERLEVVVSSD